MLWKHARPERLERPTLIETNFIGGSRSLFALFFNRL